MTRKVVHIHEPFHKYCICAVHPFTNLHHTSVQSMDYVLSPIRPSNVVLAHVSLLIVLLWMFPKTNYFGKRFTIKIHRYNVKIVYIIHYNCYKNIIFLFSLLFPVKFLTKLKKMYSICILIIHYNYKNVILLYVFPIFFFMFFLFVQKITPWSYHTTYERFFWSSHHGHALHRYFYFIGIVEFWV